MRYFLDTEFIEDGKTIELISIGMVAEDGREFYAENSECGLTRANDWVKENVIPHLWSQQTDKRAANGWSRDGGIGGLLIPSSIAFELRRFCDREQYSKPEFWGYYADYDWVVFCQLFGTMMDLPKGWPMYCRDLKQLCDDQGNPNLSEAIPQENEHHALADAHWNKDVYDFLTARARTLAAR